MPPIPGACVPTHSFYLGLLKGLHIVGHSPDEKDLGQLTASYSQSALPACQLLPSACVLALCLLMALLYNPHSSGAASGHVWVSLPIPPMHLRFLKVGAWLSKPRALAYLLAQSSSCRPVLSARKFLVAPVLKGSAPGLKHAAMAVSSPTPAEACSLTFIRNLSCLFVFLCYTRYL